MAENISTSNLSICHTPHPALECEHERLIAGKQSDCHPMCPSCTHENGGKQCSVSSSCSHCKSWSTRMWRAYRHKWDYMLMTRRSFEFEGSILTHGFDAGAIRHFKKSSKPKQNA